MKKILRIMSSVVIVICIAFVGLLIYNKIFFYGIAVSGDSMYSTLKDGQIGYARKIEFVREVKRGDIISFNLDNRTMVKRVIGLPNESIVLKDHVVYINGEALEESYLTNGNDKEISNHGVYSNLTVDLKEDEYYLMGDNRKVSYDSRYFGPVSYSNFIGKIRIIYATADCNEDCSEVKNVKLIPWILF